MGDWRRSTRSRWPPRSAFRPSGSAEGRAARHLGPQPGRDRAGRRVRGDVDRTTRGCGPGCVEPSDRERLARPAVDEPRGPDARDDPCVACAPRRRPGSIRGGARPGSRFQTAPTTGGGVDLGRGVRPGTHPRGSAVRRRAGVEPRYATSTWRLFARVSTRRPPRRDVLRLGSRSGFRSRSSPESGAVAQLASQFAIYVGAPGYGELFAKLGFEALVDRARAGAGALSSRRQSRSS